MNKRKKVMASSIAIGTLLLGSLGWLCYRDWNLKREADRESKELRKKIQKAEVEVASVSAVERRVLILRNRLKNYVAILPDDERINGFVDKLTEFAKQAGVVIESLDDSSARKRRQSRKKSRDAFERVTYKLTMKANTDRLLRFMDLFENKYKRFVRIPSFKISRSNSTVRSQAAGGASAPLGLEVAVTLETYVYNPRAKGYQQVPIRDEANKIARLRREGLLDAPGSGLDLAVYELNLTPDRRDPFVDPRVSGAGAKAVSAEERRAQLEELEALKDKLGKIHDLVAKEVTTKNSVVLVQLQGQTNDKIRELGKEVVSRSKANFFTAKKLAAEFHAAVEMPYKQLVASRDMTPAGIRTEDVRHTILEMQHALARGNFDKVLVLHGQLEELSKAAHDPQFLELFRRADKLKDRAEAHKLFQEKNLVLSGSIVYRDDPQRAVAIINNRSFSPGEAVEEGLVVKSITSLEVVFNFRGITVVRKFDREKGVR